MSARMCSNGNGETQLTEPLFAARIAARDTSSQETPEQWYLL
jgi:hypothetical protein